MKWEDLIFAECTHETFTYRPYRRGYRRCKECGGFRPLTKTMKNWNSHYLKAVEFFTGDRLKRKT